MNQIIVEESSMDGNFMNDIFLWSRQLWHGKSQDTILKLSVAFILIDVIDVE
jgi:hypothetical protein